MIVDVKTVNLGNVADFIRGITFKPTDKVEPFSPGSVVCFRTANVQEQLDQSNLIAVPESFVNRKEQLVSEGDILVSNANSWNLVGKCSWVPNLNYVAAIGGFISILRAKSELVDPRYLYHWFNSTETQVDVRNCGRQTTNISNMDINRVLKLQIPLPPLAEQQRIAAILDCADTLRAKRRAALAKLDALLQATFLDMFGDPVTNFKNLPVVALSEVCTRVTDGTHQPPKWADTGIPFLFISNVVDGELNFDTKKFISAKTYEELNTRCPIENGDILYTIVGSYGNAAIVRTSQLFSFQRHIAHIKPDALIIIPDFLLGMLQSPGVKHQADDYARGIAQKTLNLRELKSIKIFLPTRNEQDRYCQIRDNLIQQKSLYKMQLLQLDNLFHSLQQRAFSGEL